jgi:simple sugar transport system ATP-binding protein
MSNTPVLRLRGIPKHFGPLGANDDISLTLEAGEMLALLGENGAGKTTLMSILFGHYVADAGAVEVQGSPLPPGSPRAALAAGVGMVHQHFTLAGNMTVLENIMLGTEPLWGFRRNSARALAKLGSLMERFRLHVNPHAMVRGLSVGERQRVEILKVLYRDARILILDEPTAVLTPQESDHLFATLRELVSQGLSVIFITHKLREVMAASDRCVVLRHGRVVLETATHATSAEDLAKAMVGAHIPQATRTPHPPGEEVLFLDRVRTSAPDRGPDLDELRLSVRAHEILGIAGVSGNGQALLADLLSGIVAPNGGSVILRGQTVSRPTPAAMISAGVGRVPDDRTGTGLVADMTVMENLSTEIYRLPGFSKRGMLNFKALASRAAQLMDVFDIRCAGLGAPVRKLSGGNMQKLILARVLSQGPHLILANQPTWGLDVGASAAVHQHLLDAARRGAGVVLISEDLDELFQLSDRIQVMYQGRLSESEDTATVDRARLGLMMSGQTFDQRGAA